MPLPGRVVGAPGQGEQDEASAAPHRCQPRVHSQAGNAPRPSEGKQGREKAAGRHLLHIKTHLLLETEKKTLGLYISVAAPTAWEH